MLHLLPPAFRARRKFRVHLEVSIPPMGKFFHRSKRHSSKTKTPDTSQSFLDSQSTADTTRTSSTDANADSTRMSDTPVSPKIPSKTTHDGPETSSNVSGDIPETPRQEDSVASQQPIIAVTVDEGPVPNGQPTANENSQLLAPRLSDLDVGERQSQGSRKEKQGILSSLVSAAHNAANIITSTIDDDHKPGLNNLPSRKTSPLPKNSSTQDFDSELDPNHNRSFSNKLDFLLKPARFHGPHSSTSSLDHKSPEQTTSEESAPGGRDNENGAENDKEKSLVRSLSPSNVHFESVRESPLNTMGHGNLLLGHFSNNRPAARSTHNSTDSLPIKRGMSPQAVNSQLPPLSQLAVSGSGDYKRVRRKSYLSPARSQDRRLHSVAASESESSADSATMDDELDQIIDYSGVKIASEKENREFHQAFRDLPPEEKLVDDFSCALSREILVHGRMYLSEHYLCFNSSILGWVTNIRIPLQEVIQIEKKSTVKLFPNGMIVRTLHHKYVFASFLSRDSVFKQVTNAWHQVLLELADVDPKKVVASRGRSRSRSLATKALLDGVDSDDEDSTNNADLSDYSDGGNSDTDESSLPNDNDSSKGSIEVKAYPENNLLAKGSSDESEKDQGQSEGNTFRGLPLTGPLAHEPTDIGYTKLSLETFICDETINAPLGVVYLILFGADTSKYIKVLKNQKNFDIDELGVVGLSNSNKSRHYTYTKPLSGPIGPKQTKCIIDDKLIDFDFEKYILVEQDTSTPDVPSGNSFKVKTKMFLSWAANNTTRIYVLTSVEWSGKSWIKGAIEKGSIDGQKESMKLMIETLNDFVATAGSKGDKGDKKKKKRLKSTSSGQKERPPEPEPATSSAPEPGILQQLATLMESIGGLVPVLVLGKTTTGTIITMTTLVLFGWLISMVSFRGSTPMEILHLSNMITQVKINEHTYTMIPSVDSYLADRKKRLDTELALWKWINDRSDGHIRIQSQPETGTSTTLDKLKEYSAQELKEIVRITQLKLNELSKRLDSDNE